MAFEKVKKSRDTNELAVRLTTRGMRLNTAMSRRTVAYSQANIYWDGSTRRIAIQPLIDGDFSLNRTQTQCMVMCAELIKAAGNSDSRLAVEWDEDSGWFVTEPVPVAITEAA